MHIEGFFEALTNTNKDGRIVINKQGEVGPVTHERHFHTCVHEHGSYRSEFSQLPFLHPLKSGFPQALQIRENQDQDTALVFPVREISRNLTIVSNIRGNRGIFC